MEKFKQGELVRYGDGSTALARLLSPHAGGWHGQQCMGGITYINTTSRHVVHASEEDKKKWAECAHWRGDKPFPSKLRCMKCNCQRAVDPCVKCGAALEPAGCEDWEEPEIPPVDRIRELAREVGYAIGEHGSKERDLDLIAAPWSEDAVPAQVLAEHIAAGLGGTIAGVAEEKPLGRYSVNIQMNGWYKLIDLSICPIIRPVTTQVLTDDELWEAREQGVAATLSEDDSRTTCIKLGRAFVNAVMDKLINSTDSHKPEVVATLEVNNYDEMDQSPYVTLRDHTLTCHDACHDDRLIRAEQLELAVAQSRAVILNLCDRHQLGVQGRDQLRAEIAEAPIDARRYRKLLAWMSSNVPEGWAEVQKVAGVAAYVGWDAADQYIDELPECNVGLCEKRETDNG